jgi:predicted RNase H-like HicB family nuclease
MMTAASSSCPLIPGCISQGDTREEALANIRHAIKLYLANRTAEGWELPEHVEVIFAVH